MKRQKTAKNGALGTTASLIGTCGAQMPTFSASSISSCQIYIYQGYSKDICKYITYKTTLRMVWKVSIDTSGGWRDPNPSPLPLLIWFEMILTESTRWFLERKKNESFWRKFGNGSAHTRGVKNFATGLRIRTNIVQRPSRWRNAGHDWRNSNLLAILYPKLDCIYPFLIDL